MMWCGRELGNNGVFARLYGKVRAVAAPLFRKEKTERAPHLEQCFEAWLAEVRRADKAQDGGSYQALPVLEAIAAGRMPPSVKEEKQANGWMKHDGGERPVIFNAKVEVRRRDGTLHGPYIADGLVWRHRGWGTDIMEYREVSE